MASTYIPIASAIGNTNTTIYDPFTTAGATQAIISSLTFCNTTTSDITIDVFVDLATDIYLCDDKLIPAKGNVDWTGLIIINGSTQNLVAIGSASGVHVLGGALENA
jgi:hypothetical protein